MVNLAPLPRVDLERLRARKLESTQRLLGATIAVPDEEWQQPSMLPGWTRAHVASHLARNADGLARLARNAAEGTHLPMYTQDRDEEIERGSERNALELQIDLDTSAAALNEAFDQLGQDQWETPVTLRGGVVLPAHALPLARLFEVEVHHVDLGIGRTIDDIDDETARWLLDWAAWRIGGTTPRLDARLVPSDGAPLDLGNAALATVSGTTQAILGWLTGRPSASPVTGVGGLTPPAL